MAVVYRKTIHMRGGATGIDGCLTMRLAELIAIHRAIAIGWTQPRWWQFWRWDEQQQPDEIVAMTPEQRKAAIMEAEAEERRLWAEMSPEERSKTEALIRRSWMAP